MQSGSLPIFTVDAFTDKPFGGNPAAVCLEEQALTDNVRQQIAKEMNISETAFVSKLSASQDFQKDNRFGLRWFTPTNEVPLCGHATLATAAVLFANGNCSEVLEFETLSGVLYARRGSRITLDLPVNQPAPTDLSRNLVKAVIGDIPFQDVQFSQTTKKLLIRLKDGTDRSVLESISPVQGELFAASPLGGPVGGVIVTLLGTAPYHFYSRYFAPWNGILEDPVCGSAHTVLAPYWGKVLGKKELFAYQCSRRGGELWLTLREDGRLDLAGHACLILRGRITIP